MGGEIYPYVCLCLCLMKETVSSFHVDPGNAKVRSNKRKNLTIFGFFSCLCLRTFNGKPLEIVKSLVKSTTFHHFQGKIFASGRVSVYLIYGRVAFKGRWFVNFE